MAAKRQPRTKRGSPKEGTPEEKERREYREAVYEVFGHNGTYYWDGYYKLDKFSTRGGEALYVVSRGNVHGHPARSIKEAAQGLNAVMRRRELEVEEECPQCGTWVEHLSDVCPCTACSGCENRRSVKHVNRE